MGSVVVVVVVVARRRVGHGVISIPFLQCECENISKLIVTVVLVSKLFVCSYIYNMIKNFNVNENTSMLLVQNTDDVLVAIIYIN